MNVLGNPVSVFLDSNGQPLQGGSIYIGQPNIDPTNPANQITVYQDQGLSIPLQQPIKTTNGQPSLNGQQIPVYLGVGVTTYALAALNAGGVVVMSQPNCAPFSLGGSASGNMTVKEYVAGTDYVFGTSTTLPLPGDPGSGANCFVDFDGVPQHYPDDFTLNSSRTQLVFSSPISAPNKVYLKFGTTQAVGTPAAGSVTDSSVAANAAIQSTKLAFIQAGVSAVTRTVQDKLRERLSAADFGAKGDGTTDDTAALSAMINEANVLGAVGHLNPGSTYIISGALPPITTTGAGLECNGGGGDNQNDSGCIIKATGTAGYTMVTLSSIIGQRKATHLRFKGIALDANSIAAIGLSITSIDYSEINVVGWNATSMGVFIGCVNGALLTDPQDTQRNTISIVWQQETHDVPCVLLQNGTTGNPSFNNFPILYAVNTAGIQPAVTWIGTDNNIYENVALGTGGTNYAGIFESSNAAPNFGSNNELFIKVSANNQVYVQGGGTYSNPKMIRVLEYDESNGTPGWHADTGTGLIDPLWRQYFPTLTFSGGGGSFSNVTVQYRRNSPTTVDWKALFTVASSGGVGSVNIPLNVGRTGVAADTIHGQEISSTGKAVTGNIPAGTTTAQLGMYDGTAPLNGYTIAANGSYQCGYLDTLV